MYNAVFGGMENIMKKRGFIVGLLILLLVSFSALGSFALSDEATILAEVGKIFKEYDINENNSDIYAQGKTGAVVTVDDIEMATDFYIKAGNTEENARKKAIDFMLEREALYQKAVSLGFTASDEEIRNCINELKNLVKTADNGDDIQYLIDQFESEEDFWDFEYKVYTKKLPILKYLESLKEDYYSSENLNSPNSNEKSNNAEDCAEYIESVKEKLVKDEFGTIN